MCLNKGVSVYVQSDCVVSTMCRTCLNTPEKQVSDIDGYRQLQQLVKTAENPAIH